MSDNQKVVSGEKKYTEKDMLFAFKHGRYFEPLPGIRGCEMASDTAEKHLPFWEWLSRKYPAEQSNAAEADNEVCPSCGGPADNGHDRCLPPNPYNCTKCSN